MVWQVLLLIIMISVTSSPFAVTCFFSMILLLVMYSTISWNRTMYHSVSKLLESKDKQVLHWRVCATPRCATLQITQ